MNKILISAVIVLTVILYLIGMIYLGISLKKVVALLLVESSLIFLLFKVIISKTKTHFSTLSTHTKVVMLIGLLSVLLVF